MTKESPTLRKYSLELDGPMSQMAALSLEEPQKRRDIHKKKREREPRKRRVIDLEREVQQLRTEVQQLKRREEGCPHCSFYKENQWQQRTISEIPRQLQRQGSLRFEQINLSSALMSSPEMEERSWVLLGLMMVAMGSKVLDVDGTVSVFRVLKECVDGIRRQVEKSQRKITMDFFLSREDLYEDNGIFLSNYDKRGLQLEGLRLESVDEGELFFDYRLKFGVDYEALLTIKEYVKDFCYLE